MSWCWTLLPSAFSVECEPKSPVAARRHMWSVCEEATTVEEHWASLGATSTRMWRLRCSTKCRRSIARRSDERASSMIYRFELASDLLLFSRFCILWCVFFVLFLSCSGDRLVFFKTRYIPVLDFFKFMAGKVFLKD